MRHSEYYEYNLPEGEDYYNVEDFNENAEKIDMTLHEHQLHVDSRSNPHGVTKEQLGLGNVENKSSATIRGELTSSDISSALGFTPATSSVATTSANGLMSSSDKSKLNGIASGAEVNVQADWNVTDTNSDAYIRNKPTKTILTGTLPSTQTMITFTNSLISGDVYLDVYTNMPGLKYSAIEYNSSNNSVTLTFPAQASDDVTVKLVIQTI